MNTGVADAHNLAWKLAEVLAGRAGDGLLDTYQAERLPVARFTVEQALLVQRNPKLHWDLRSSLAEREKLGMADPFVVSLGYQYDSAAVIGARAAAPSLSDPLADLDGHPGSRVPHLWVDHDGVRKSTVDVAVSGFTLLAGPSGHAWLSAATAVPELTALRVAVDGDLRDAEERWSGLAGIKPDGALLVRPDGFVAWRCNEVTVDAAAELRGVLDRLLSRTFPVESPSTAL